MEEGKDAGKSANQSLLSQQAASSAGDLDGKRTTVTTPKGSSEGSPVRTSIQGTGWSRGYESLTDDRGVEPGFDTPSPTTPHATPSPLAFLKRGSSPLRPFGGVEASGLSLRRGDGGFGSQTADSELLAPLLKVPELQGGVSGGMVYSEDEGSAHKESSEGHQSTSLLTSRASGIADALAVGPDAIDSSGEHSALMDLHQGCEGGADKASPRHDLDNHWEEEDPSWDDIHDLDFASTHLEHQHLPAQEGEGTGCTPSAANAGGSFTQRRWRRARWRSSLGDTSNTPSLMTSATVENPQNTDESAQVQAGLGTLGFGQGAPLDMPCPPPKAAIATGELPPSPNSPDPLSMAKSPIMRHLSNIFSAVSVGLTETQSSWNSQDSRADLMQAPEEKQPRRRRNWVVIDDSGKASVKSVEKLYMTLVLGVPSRDIRVIDPLAPRPYPSAVFIREKAIVLNLEGVKAIVTHDQVFLLAVPFQEVARMTSVWAPITGGNTQQADDYGFATARGVIPTRDHPFVLELSKRIQDSRDSLPFSLQVLDAAMAGAHNQLEKQVAQLEQATQLSLDALVVKVSRANLERVQVVKSKITKLMARVEKLKEEIDKLLDDDDDMRALYLREHYANESPVAEAGGNAWPGAKANYSRATSGRGKGGPSGNNRRKKRGTSWASLSLVQGKSMSSFPATAAAGEGADLSLEAGSDADANTSETMPRSNFKRHQRTTVSGKPRQLHRASIGNMRKSKSELSLAKMGATEAQARAPSRFNLGSASRTASDAGTAATTAPQVTAKAARPKNARATVKEGFARRLVMGMSRNRKLRRGHADVQEAEALLEVLVTSMEFLDSRLAFLKERIDDTEDFLLIELDSSFNELQSTHVSLLVLGLSWQACAMVAVIWGQNLCQGCKWHSDSGPDANRWLFFFTVGYVFLGMAILAFGFFAYIQIKGLSYMPGYSFFTVAIDTLTQKSASSSIIGLG